MPGYPKNSIEQGYSIYNAPIDVINAMEDKIAVVVDELSSGLLTYEPDITTNSLSGSMLLNYTLPKTKIVAVDWATKQDVITLGNLSGTYIADGTVTPKQTSFLVAGVSGINIGKFGPLMDADGANVYIYISGGAISTSRT